MEVGKQTDPIDPTDYADHAPVDGQWYGSQSEIPETRGDEAVVRQFECSLHGHYWMMEDVFKPEHKDVYAARRCERCGERQEVRWTAVK